MPSEIDQAAPPQSIEERLGSVFKAEMSEPEVEAAAPEEPVDQADEPETEESAQDQEPAVDEVEVEVEGWKGKIPTKLKAELDKAQDYTRKTQTLADEKRLFETQQRTLVEHQQFMQAAQEEISRFQQIESQLEQYRGVDLSQIDAETLSRMSIAAGNLREERAKLKEAIEAKKSQYQSRMMQNWDEMTAKAREVIVKSIPSWDKVAPEVAKYALNEGFQYEHITGYDRQTGARVGPGVVDPTFAKTLYKAMQWDKLQASKATTTNKVANAPPVLKPGAPTSVQATQRQKALAQQHKQKGTVDSAAALLRKYF